MDGNDPGGRKLGATAATLAGLLAIAGLGGGTLLALDPSGATIGLDPAMLDATPFPNFLLPGLALFVLEGLVPLVAAFAAMPRRPWAPEAVLVAGATTLAWMAAQLLWIGWWFWIQGLVIGWGLGLVALGVAWITLARGSRART